jgi:hypothetical protein
MVSGRVNSREGNGCSPRGGALTARRRSLIHTGWGANDDRK